jgi:hypothetical protein
MSLHSRHCSTWCRNRWLHHLHATSLGMEETWLEHTIVYLCLPNGSENGMEAEAASSISLTQFCRHNSDMNWIIWMADLFQCLWMDSRECSELSRVQQQQHHTARLYRAMSEALQAYNRGRCDLIQRLQIPRQWAANSEAFQLMLLLFLVS